MEEVLNRKSNGFVWLDYFTENQNIEKLTREVVVSLIREIKVFDKNHIEVIFDFDDCYKELKCISQVFLFAVLRILLRQMPPLLQQH